MEASSVITHLTSDPPIIELLRLLTSFHTINSSFTKRNCSKNYAKETLNTTVQQETENILWQSTV